MTRSHSISGIVGAKTAQCFDFSRAEGMPWQDILLLEGRGMEPIDFVLQKVP